MKNLYEIAHQYEREFLELADSDIEGIDQSVIDSTLEGMEGEFEMKAINIAKFIANLEHESDGVLKAERRMRGRKQAIEKKIDWLKKYLLENMIRTGILKCSSPELAVSVLNCKSHVDIIDDALIPTEFMVFKTTSAPDKSKILNHGGCPGAVVVPGKYLRFK